MPAATIPAELSAHLQGLPADPNIRTAALIDWGFVRIMDQAIDAIGVESVVSAAQAAFEKYVVPLDIPGIPNEMEPIYFDAPAKLLIGMAIRGFHSAIHKPGPLMGAAAPRTWIGEAA